MVKFIIGQLRMVSVKEGLILVILWVVIGELSELVM